MRNRLGYIILLSALALSEPAFAVTRQSQTTLNAFLRYEPEFSTALRTLQDLDRKLKNAEGDEASEIWLKAEGVMGNVEDRYDSLEDLFNITLSRNPGDQVELQDGFNKLDDAYRLVRDFYTDNYTYRNENAEKQSVEVVEAPASTPSGYKDTPYSVQPISAADDYKLSLSSDEPKKHGVDVIGSIKVNYRDAKEIHQSTGLDTPNDFAEGHLLLTYEMNENRSFSIDEKYFTKERNEKSRENHLTLSYFTKHGDNSGFTVRDKLQHVWYPDNSAKNYRVNLLEGIYTKIYDNNHERTLTGAFKAKRYSKNSRSDYNQYSLNDSETWINRDNTVFAELKSDFVKYRNAGNLDYKNLNLYVEVDQSYSGNKAEMKISDTYDRRLYETESIAAYRTSYYDNIFQFSYELPVNDKVTYTFDGDYTKHNYGSDEPRGYAELNVFNGVVIKTDRRTYLKGDFRYVYNDENTRSSAHRNNIYHIGWQRNFNRDYRLTIDDTYHDRNSVENGALDFKQNTLTTDFSWRIKKNYRLSWVSEYFQRDYDRISLGVADYRYFESGFDISYSKRKAYDWKISQKWRNMSFRNWGGVATDWTTRVQPVTEIKYNHWLRDNLKLGLRATWEKTYYREYNNDSQELEYHFDDLMYNKEIFASLEYIF